MTYRAYGEKGNTMKAENRKQRVRGYVVVGTRSTGCVGKDDPQCVTAYTHWYRHDDDLKQLDRELEQLQTVYRGFSKTDCMMVGYEYADYKR
jgi:hypothetical protein